MPITIGGLGVRESGYSGLIRHAGGAAAQGASTGFTLGVLLVLSNLVFLGAVEVFERVGRSSQLQEEPAKAAA